MKSQRRIFYWLIRFLKEGGELYIGDLKELKTTYSDIQNVWIRTLINILIIIPFTLFFLFVYVIGVLVMVSVMLLFTCKDIILNWNNAPAISTGLTTTVFNEYAVRELLCDVLRNNAAELGVIAPKTVGDITPTEYKVLQDMNGIKFARFIVAYSGCDDVDFDTFLSLLNSKIWQQLQLKYPDYVLVYNNIKVITVFNVGYDLYHNGYFSIDIIVVDNDMKYNYLQRLFYQKAAARTTVDSSNLNDKDF